MCLKTQNRRCEHPATSVYSRYCGVEKHLYGPTDLGVTAAVGGATTSGVRGSSSSVCEVQSMSLALLLPDTPVLASTTASPSSSPPVAADSSGDAVSASALAGMSSGWDRAELKWKRGIIVYKIQLHLFVLLKTTLRLNHTGNGYLYMDSPSGRLVSKQSGRMMM